MSEYPDRLPCRSHNGLNTFGRPLGISPYCVKLARMDDKFYPGFSGFLPEYDADTLPSQGQQLPDFSQLGLYCTGQPVTSLRPDGIDTTMRTPLDGATSGPDFVCSPGARIPPAELPSTVVAKEKNKAAQRAYRQRNKVAYI